MQKRNTASLKKNKKENKGDNIEEILNKVGCQDFLKNQCTM